MIFHGNEHNITFNTISYTAYLYCCDSILGHYLSTLFSDIMRVQMSRKVESIIYTMQLLLTLYHVGRIRGEMDTWFTDQYLHTLKISFNTLRLSPNGRLFTEDISRCIFFNENVWISIKSLFLRVQLIKFPTLVQIMAWRHPGNKPLFEPMLISLPTHICVTRPQWAKNIRFRN